MRIVRYPLEIVDYQQVQPLWPGRVLSVASGRPEIIQYRGDGPPAGSVPHFVGSETVYISQSEQKIDMWCLDVSDSPGAGPAPILGVWIVGTGHPMPDGLLADDTNCFHGTCVMANGLVWHVFTTIEGAAEPAIHGDTGAPGSIDEMIDQIKARHAHRRQP